MKAQLPNIFEYATKELSQDAFLCWLLSLADHNFATEELMPLHQLSVELIRKLMDMPEFSFSKVKVKKQKQRIDIWVEIDDKYLLIIEDKTISNAGIDQLKTYKKIALDFCKTKKYKKTTCVYLKTGLESTKKFSDNAKNEGWRMFSLEDLYNVFQPYISKITHPFITDFYTITQHKIERRNNFASLITKDKSADDVVSVFFMNLENSGIFKRWSAVDIRGTRRLFADNCYIKEGEYAVYLQLEKMKLRVKVDLGQLRNETGKKYKPIKKSIQEKNVRSIFDDLKTKLSKHKNFEGIVERPQKFSAHNYLTFADINDEAWLVFKDDNTLDYEATASQLKKINANLQKFIQTSKGDITTIIEKVFPKTT